MCGGVTKTYEARLDRFRYKYVISFMESIARFVRIVQTYIVNACVRNYLCV